MKNRIFKLVTAIFLMSSLLAGTAFAFPSSVLAKQSSHLSGGVTIYREVGGPLRAEASSWHLGKCTSQTEKDWIVTYKVKKNKKQWANAETSQLRFYASGSSLVRWYPGLYTAYVKKASPSGVTLCISSGNGLIKASDIKGTWVWLETY